MSDFANRMRVRRGLSPYRDRERDADTRTVEEAVFALWSKLPDKVRKDGKITIAIKEMSKVLTELDRVPPTSMKYQTVGVPGVPPTWDAVWCGWSVRRPLGARVGDLYVCINRDGNYMVTQPMTTGPFHDFHHVLDHLLDKFPNEYRHSIKPEIYP